MAENFMLKLLNEHAERLEADHQKLKLVRVWYDHVASLSVSPYVTWDDFVGLEEILGVRSFGPDKSAK